MSDKPEPNKAERAAAAKSMAEATAPVQFGAKVVLSLNQIGDELKVGLEFDPPLIMPDAEAFKAMPPAQKNFQNYTAHVGNSILDVLQLDLKVEGADGTAE